MGGTRSVTIGLIGCGLAASAALLSTGPRATPSPEPVPLQGLGPSAVVDGMTLYRLDVADIEPRAPGTMRVGVMAPAVGEPRADILFIHGHADRLDNHGPLFTAWRDAGFRVLAFDLPSHGASRIGPIDIYPFERLFALARRLERATRADPARPLILAGWSFGGLVTARLAQRPDALHGFGRSPAAVLLLAPAVAPLAFAGGDGIARPRTLTHTPNPPVAGPPSPAAPLANPVFAGRLLLEARAAGYGTLPRHIPTLVIAAGPTADVYVDARGVLAWADGQRSAGADVQALRCPDARHFLDMEPYPIGTAVRRIAVGFAEAAVAGRAFAASDGLDPLEASACAAPAETGP